MQIRNFWSSLLIGSSLILFSKLNADHCGGKIDLAPAFVHVDVLESGHTIKKLDMGGVKCDINYLIKEGWGFCIKPSVLYAQGHGELINGGIGLGHVTPINDCLCITPSAGGTWTNLRTSVSLMGVMHLKERFRSIAPYVAIDISYKIMEGLRVCASYQYSWSRTHTRIQTLGKFKGNSKGPSYAAMIEKDFNKYWSINAGAAYNVSLNHEKHGLRGYGFKIGVVRWLY